MKKRIAILGSTGSIGTQALDVIRQHKEHFSIEVLTAQQNADLLIEQALEFIPDTVVIADESQYKKVKDILDPRNIKVYAGTEALSQVVELDNIDYQKSYVTFSDTASLAQNEVILLSFIYEDIPTRK